MDFFISALALIIILGLLVFVHELGHFVVAKLIGVRVEEFAFGFGPRLIGKKIGQTEYRINALPLGGYVKIYGESISNEIYSNEKLAKVWKDLELYKIKDEKTLEKKVNESKRLSEKEKKLIIGAGKERLEAMNSSESFVNKPIGQRALVIVAGVTMNFLLAIIIFLFYFSLTNFTTELAKRADYHFIGAEQRVDERPIAVYSYRSDLKDEGIEKVLIWKINGEFVEGREEFQEFIKENEGEVVNFTIVNDKGDYLDKSLVLNTSELDTNLDEEIQNKVIIRGVREGGPAQKAGLEEGNIILQMNGEEVIDVDQFINLLDANHGQTVSMKVINQDGKEEIVSVELDKKEKEDDPVFGGFLSMNEPQFIEFYHLDYGKSKGMAGFYHSINILGYQMKVLVVLIRDSVVSGSVGPVAEGVGSIVVVANEVHNLVRTDNFADLVNLAGLVSVALAFMNILPIPLFDGGHLMFLAIEKIKGRRISVEKEEKISKISFMIIIVLSVLIILKDILVLEWIPRLIGLIKGLFS